MDKLKSYKEIPEGGLIVNPGNSEEYKTGDWRTYKPVFDTNQCKGCMLCYIYCPENAITLNKDNKIVSIDYDHCKGCGICVQSCKFGAIKMVLEGSDDKKGNKKEDKKK